MSAITQRSRRATAGKRMANLVGKAVEDDESFWNHDTWADNGEDDGNDSFHESDEDSDVRKDHFDSDFDDSESDHEAEDVAAGADEEKRLRQEEKASRRTAMDGVARAGRELLQKKRGRMKGNRIFGDGMNAGLVLNFPPNFGQTGYTPSKPAATIMAGTSKIPPILSATPTKLAPPASPSVASAAAAAAAAAAESTVVKQPATVRSAPVIRAASVRSVPLNSAAAVKGIRVTLASTRARRGKKHLRTSTQESTKASTAHIKGSKATRSAAVTASTAAATKRSKRRMFSQEELLLEAATITESENGRWLLGRKRLYQQAEAARNAQNQKQGSSKLLQRYVSKRGCFNTLNFSEMDAVPKILLPNTSTTAKPKPVQPTMCIITGQRARYKDPKTQLGYYDLLAFRELRRRHLAGEPLKTPPLVVSKIKSSAAAALPLTKKAKLQKQQPPKPAVAVAKPIEVPSLQPKATPLVTAPAAPAPVAATVISSPSIATPAATTTTPPTSIRAQRTVQDPDRNLTMTTRNASNHISPENAKPTSKAAVVAASSQLIPPVPTLTSTAAAASPIITTANIKPNKKRDAAPTVASTSSKKARATKNDDAPLLTAAPAVPSPALPASALPASVPAPTAPVSIPTAAIASTPVTVVTKNNKASPVAAPKTMEDSKPTSGSTMGKKITTPTPGVASTARSTAMTMTANPLSDVAKKAADQAAASSVIIPVVAKDVVATMSTATKLAVPKDPVARNSSAKKASEASQAKNKSTTAVAPAKKADADEAAPVAKAAAMEESSTAPPPKLQKRKSSLRISPNTLVHTALAAYIKQQHEEPKK